MQINKDCLQHDWWTHHAAVSHTCACARMHTHTDQHTAHTNWAAFLFVNQPMWPDFVVCVVFVCVSVCVLVCWQRCKPQHLPLVIKMQTHTQCRGFYYCNPTMQHKIMNIHKHTCTYTTNSLISLCKTEISQREITRTQKDKQQANKHTAEREVEANPFPPDLQPPTSNLQPTLRRLKVSYNGKQISQGGWLAGSGDRRTERRENFIGWIVFHISNWILAAANRATQVKTHLQSLIGYY